MRDITGTYIRNGKLFFDIGSFTSAYVGYLQSPRLQEDSRGWSPALRLSLSPGGFREMSCVTKLGTHQAGGKRRIQLCISCFSWLHAFDDEEFSISWRE